MATGELPPLPPFTGRLVLLQVDVLVNDSGCFGDEPGEVCGAHTSCAVGLRRSP